MAIVNFQEQKLKVVSERKTSAMEKLRQKVKDAKRENERVGSGPTP
ncbi:hypothetical protein [Vibrio owensii]